LIRLLSELVVDAPSFFRSRLKKAGLAFPFLLPFLAVVPLVQCGASSLIRGETQITSILMDHGTVSLHWEVRAGKKYAVQFGASLPPDESWTKVDDIMPPWECQVDGGARQCFFRVVCFSIPLKLVINEIMYNPLDDPDQKREYVELYNYGDLPIDLSGFSFVTGIQYTFRQGVILPSGQYLVVAKDPKYMFIHYGGINIYGPFEGKLDNGGEILELADASGDIVDSVNFNDDPPWDVGADGTGSSLELIDPTRDNDIHDNWRASQPLGAGGTPGAPNSVFELETPPFIYLHSRSPDEPTSSDTISISIKVTDNGLVLSVLLKYDDGSGVRVVPMFDDGTHDDLSADDSVYGAIIGPFPDKTTVTYTIEATDDIGQVSTHPDYPPNQVKVICVNDDFLTDRFVKINEVMYHPPEDAAGQEDAEFVELFNSSSEAVHITGWRLSGAIDFTFPEKVLGAGEYAVVCLSKEKVAGIYALPGGLLFGNYTGRLANDGEKINLRNKNGVLLESVEYDDQFPWPVAADGYGYSLERIDVTADPSSPQTWGAAPPPIQGPTQAEWRFFETVGTPTTSRLYFYLMGNGECLIDDVELVSLAGGEDILSNGGFEDGTNGWQKAGNQDFAIEAQARPGSAGSSSLEIISSGVGSGSGNAIYQDGIPVIFSTRYKLSFWAKWLAGASSLTVRFSGATGSASDPLLATFDLKPSSLTDFFSFASPGRRNHCVKSPPPPIVTAIARSPSRHKETDVVRIEAAVTPSPEISSVSLEATVGASTTVVPMFDDGLNGGDAEAGDNTYTATLPPQAPYTIVRYKILITGHEGEIGRSPRIQAPGQTYAYYVEGAVDTVSSPNPIYSLYVKPSDLSLIASYAALGDPAHPNWNKTVPGTFIYKGEAYDVEVRYRGSRWCRYQSSGKMSFKIDFPRYHQFDGRPDINLNSQNHYGFTGYEEALAFEMCRRVGVAAPMTNFARLNVNGKYHGFFLQIESPGEEFLEAQLGEEGDLFKSMGDPLGRFPYDWGDWRPLSSLQKYEDVYPRRSRKYDSHEIIRDVIEGMSRAANTSTLALEDFLRENFDMQRTLSYIATAAWIAVWDEAFHNFFAYRDTAAKWMVFPWDTDGCFGANGASRYTNSIFVGEHGNPDNRGGWSNELKHYIFSVPALRKEYVLRLEVLNNYFFVPDKLRPYLNSVSLYVGKDADEDPFGWSRKPADELKDVELFIEQRYQNIKQQIQIEKQKPYFQ